MSIRSAKRSVPGKWCSSAAPETNSGKKVNRVATCYAYAKFAWIATRMRYSFAWKRWDLAFATRATGAVSFARSNRMAEQRSLQKELFHRKQSTDRRSANEPVEAGNPQRKPARRDAGFVCARGLENHVEFAELRAHD